MTKHDSAAPPITKHAWEREYELQMLPTSRNTLPSRAIQYWIRFLNDNMLPLQGRVLDVACGTGRNSIYLAAKGAVLCGMDIAENALRTLRTKALSEGVQDQVTAVCASMDTNLPFISGSFDYALCLTAIENLVTDAQAYTFASELHRILRGGGLVLLYRLCENDGFYEPRISVGGDGRRLAFAEDLGVLQRIFALLELKQIFSPSFRIVGSEAFLFDDSRGDCTYRRSLQSLVLERL